MAENTALQAIMRNEFAAALNLRPEHLQLHQSFLAQGGDSLSAIHVMSKCRSYSISADIVDILQSKSLSEVLAETLARQKIDANADASSNGHLMNAKRASQSQYTYRSITVGLARPISLDALRNAVSDILTNHPVLRARWSTDAVSSNLLSAKAARDGLPILEEHVVDSAQACRRHIERLGASLELDAGVVFAASLFRLSASQQTLVLLAHDSVVDSTSWRIVCQELDLRLSQDASQSTPEFLFHDWLLAQQSCPVPTTLNYQVSLPNRGEDFSSYVTVLEEAFADNLLQSDRHAEICMKPSDIVHAALMLAWTRCMPAEASQSIVQSIQDDRKSRPELANAIGCFEKYAELEIIPLSNTRLSDYLRLVTEAVEQSHKVARVLAPRESRDNNWPRIRVDCSGMLQEPISSGAILIPFCERETTEDVCCSADQRCCPEITLFARNWNGVIYFHFHTTIAKSVPLVQLAHSFKQHLVYILTAFQSGSSSSALNGTLSLQDLGSMPDAQPEKLHQRPDAELARLAQLKAVAPDSVGHVDSVDPCSSMQNRILISQSVHAAAYYCSFIVTVRTHDGGPLTAYQMAHHWRSIVMRHPSLRTTFIESEQRPSSFDQIVWDAVQPNVTILQDANQVNSAQDVPSTSAGVPHHLYLAQIAPTEVILRLNVSHAVIDGRSAGILLRDLCNAFSGELCSTESLRHADFVLAEDQVVEGAEEFWKTYLHGAEETYLPGAVSNDPKTGLYTLQGKLHISPKKTREFCDTHRVTMVNVCQVAWGVVLRSFALKEDVSFSYVTSGRQTNLHGMHEAVGLFISSLVLRMDFAYNTKVLDLLRAANGDVLRGMLHDNGLKKKSSKWGNSILSFQRAWESESKEHDPLRLEVLRRLSPTDYDHSINVEIGQDTISVDYGIWNSTTDKTDAEKILSAFLRAITFILANPDAGFGDVDVLGPDDLKMLHNVNGIPPTPCSTCIHSLIEETTSRQPNAVAVCAWDGTMTYRALDQQASKLAKHLLNLGVGPEVIVGMCMEKSRWAAVSTLAILKAGGVVLPLSTQQPLARLLIVLNDTRARIVLVDAGQMGRLSGEGLPELHLIQVEAKLLDGLDFIPDGQVICPDVEPSNAAWIVYTSGSTGVPKGVVLQHSALCSSIQAHGAAFGVTSDSRVLQFASHTFDVMIQETFTTLCHGGCVCVPSEQARLNNLEDAILSMDVNFLSLTSTVAGLPSPAKLPAIRTVILMGEPVKPAVLDLWMNHAFVLESYAPSECSIYATCSPKPMKSIKQAPILGAPLSSCFWVVEPKNRNRLVPIGAPGELLIEGPLLARGYLNDVEKTNKSFMVDPDFIKQYRLGSNRRMYCTGDLVRQNDNGTYSTLGRRDMQINVRGQRVEIGEVEYHITQRSPGTQAVIVLLQQNFENGTLVAAFSLDSKNATAYNSLTVEKSNIVDKPAAMLVASDLQQYLAQHVPDYMIPRIWVPVAKLPVNTSGKVDRRAVSTWINSLSDEEIASFAESDEVQAEEFYPATDTERQIREVWSTVLNIPVSRIAYRRSFLSYGGDSITAMQVVSACGKLGLNLSVRRVLQSGAISELALDIGKSLSSKVADLPDEPFNLSPVQHMYFNEVAPSGVRVDREFRFNQSVCLHLQTPTPRAKVASAIETLVAKHAMLRARFHSDATKGWQQRIEKQLVGSYRFHSHAVEGEKAAQNVIQHSQGSLDIEHGPVFAADVIEITTPERQVLFLTAHHLVIDLMSWRILVHDLEQLLLSGTTHPSYSMSFPKWCSVLAEEAQQHGHEETASPLPNDTTSWTYWGLQPGQYTSSDLVFVNTQIDEETTNLLLGPAVNSAVRSTPADILLAGLLLSFRNIFPERGYPAIFAEGHGRDGPADCDVSDTVGWFTTITPLQVLDTGEASAVSLLKQVKELRRTGADRQILDFANHYLTEAGRAASASHSPREVMFNYHGQFQQLERDRGILRLDKLHRDLQDPVGFSKCSPKRDAIQQWTQEYSRIVVELVHELLRVSPTATPSDFPLARLNSDAELAMVKEQCLLPAKVTSWHEVEDILPCSAIQQGILLSQMKSPSTYWLKQTCRVLPTATTQSVNTERLADAWRAVLRQHSIMRTIFTATPLHQDRFYQIVLTSPAANIQHVMCADSDVQQCIEMHSLQDDRPGQPLHLFLIITTTGGNTYGHFEISHALVDASSVQLLVDALLTAYEEPSTAAIHGSKYSTYVSYLEKYSEEEDLHYWQNLLAVAEPCILRSDQNLGAISMEVSGALPLVATAMIEDTSALYDFCHTHSVTVANVVQLAWTLVLSSRVDSGNQISFGYLSSGRDVPIADVETLIGPMINMMICHFDMQSMSQLTSSEAVRSVQDQFLEGFEHQRVSLAAIQHSLRQSLFNTTVSYRRTPDTDNHRQAGPLYLDKITAEESTEYDFSLNILATESGFELSLQYWPTVASPGAVQRLLAQFKHIIGALCTNPTARLCDLELLSPEDQLSIRTKNEVIPLALEKCIHTVAYEVAKRQPDAIAIHAWDGMMTYSELDDVASRLGRYLATLFGIGPEIKVGICMEKSCWAVVAMFATLKAGGVVLPLSTRQPHARLRMVLDDTEAPIVLVDARQTERLSGLGPRLIKIDKMLLDSLPNTTEIISSEVRPSNAAWIVYTSGSTGIPKGVVLEHRALCTSLVAHGTAFGLGTDLNWRVLQFASHTFDVTIQEVFTTLFFGGCVCVPSEEDRLNNLEHAIVSLKVNFLSLTSTVAGLLEPNNLHAVKKLILLGEPVNPLVLEKWVQRATVLGAYGPSECSIQVTTSSRPFAHRKQAPVLGVPLASSFWVVDPKDANYNRLCPIGAPGELLIEGPLLARGYLNDPVKTEKSFIIDPGFVERNRIGGTGRRMYRTGDLVLQNDDGTYTILGRRDTQIKIRGQRVEIGEVEYHIGRHPSQVHAAVILSQRDDFDDKKLVAAFSLPSDSGYNSTTVEEGRLVNKPAAMLVASEIQHYLSQHVPDYMIPRLWIPFSKLPVNISGKIDRLSVSKYVNNLSAEELASYSECELAEAKQDELPATSTERQVRQIWSNVLNVPITHVGYRRSFLSYGGDSITAMQVVSACRKLGLVLTVRDVLQSHAVSELALVARKSALGGQIGTEISDKPFDLSPAQRMYFQNIAIDGLRSQGQYRFNQSVCFRLQLPVQQQAKVARAIEALASKHAMLRARFEARADGGKGWQQRIEKQLVGSYHFQTHVAQDDEAAQAVIRASQGSLNIEHGPVFAADLLELPDRQLLLLTAHHLVVDLVSWRIIAQDLEQLLRSGTTSASCAVPFPAWCSLLAQQAQQRTSPKALAAPASENDAPSWTYWGLQYGQYIWADQACITAHVDEQTTSLLLGHANGALRTSPADILLTALYLSFQEVFTDRSGPAIFIEGHGRGSGSIDCDLSETVGWFTTITPLRLAPRGGDGASTVPLTTQVKDIRKLDTNRLALEFASQYLTEDGTNTGPIEVLFNYHGQFQQLEREGSLIRLDTLHQTAVHSDTSSVGGSVKMQAALNVEVSVKGGKAEINIGFSRHSLRQDAIREWGSRYCQTIARTVRELSNTAPTATSSDFPLAHLTNSDLVMMKERCFAQAGITWDDVEDILPCSPVQQGILLSQLKSPSTYHLKETCRILPAPNSTPGRVDTARLASSWVQVMHQHSIMRTIFTGALLHQDRFYQIVLKSPEPNVHVVECATDADVQKCVDIHAVGENHPGRPQHQFLIVATAKEGNVYGRFRISHALVDASSVQILVDSLLQAYEGITPIPRSTYSTYVSYLETRSEEEKDLRYWHGLLAGAEPCNLQLNQSPFAKATEIETEPVVTLALRDIAGLYNFCRTYSVTVANVFQLAWALVVSSRTDSRQVSFGYLSSGRDVPIDGVDTLVGPMINMMICHLELDHNMTPSQATQKMQERFLEGFEHQRAPLATIQHSLDTPQQSLFNTTVSYRRAAPGSTRARSIQLERVDAAESTEYDFNLSIMAEDSTIELILQYLPAIASAEAAHRLLCQLKHMIGVLCNAGNVNARLGDLELISPEDEQVVRSTNTKGPPAIETCIHSLVQEVTARQSRAEAICAWDGTMTYQTLDEAASKLAHYLSTPGVGVGPEIMVGVCMDKSRWAVVSMLAILKAGGVVLPLSTQQPHARLQIVLDDTKAPVILVDTAQEKRLANIGPRLVKVDSAMLDSLPAGRSQLVCPQVQTTHAAWVVYTSGSTGLPKGVILQHSALCTSIQSHGAAFGVGPYSRVLQFASHTFDVTIQEVFTTLSRGGCVCIPSEEQRLNNLEQAVLTMGVNFLSLTSTVAGLLSPRRLPAVQTVILMGEPVKPAVLDLWKEVTVLESYAPSECSIYATCSPQSMTHHKQVPVLGVPLASCFWVVDPSDYNRLCPIGAPGELLIEGPLLARGYLNDEIKTQKSFIENPGFIKRYGLDHGHSRRMYRTGDLVRQNEDGTYTTLGRRDMQIKIWGQRVEVSEIEYWSVRLHPELRTAAAMLARTGTARDQGVLAVAVDFTENGLRDMEVDSNGFLKPSTRLLHTLEQVRSSLIEALPRYMVPELFVPMAQLPLNTSGKSDRRAIQEAMAALINQGRIEAYFPATAVKTEVNTETARQLRSLWAEILGRSANTIGANDNFFHAGGDSLMAMRLVQLSRDAPFSLTVADVFEHPRLSDLARVLEKSSATTQAKINGQELAPFSLWTEITPKRPDALQSLLTEVAERCATAPEQIDDVYPCTPLQESLMLATTRRSTAYVSRRLFALDDDIDTVRLQAAWYEVVKAAPILRTRILLGQSTGSLQVVVNEELHWQTSDTLDGYLDKDRATGMAEGQPLVRLGLVIPPTGKRHFVWTAHHSVYDGWSMQLMYQQVAALYHQQTPPSLEPFTRFIAYLGTADNKKAAEYWREQFTGDVIADFPPLPHARYQPLPTQRRTWQMQFGQRSKSTVPLSILLRAAWGILAAQFAGTRDVAFAATLSGRNAPIAGMTDMLAPTVTTVPLRLHVDTFATVRCFLKKLHQQAIKMIPFEHTGLQRIRELVPDLAAALARIRLIVRDAAAQFVLADEQQTARLDSMETELLTIEMSFLKALASSSIKLCARPRPKPSDAAWIIYTSGSTGVPKGVVLEHGALSISTTAHGAAFGLGVDSRALQFAAYTFDASIQEIFTTLRYGGCVCVPSEEQRMNDLEACTAAMGVNFLSLTSTVAGFLDPVRLPAVNTLVLLGEPVKHAVLDLWMDHATVYNGYGPTECTIYSSCSPPIAHRKHASLLGFPLAGCFWVVDPHDHNRLCPIGVPGELLIEGPLLAREYLNDPFKTKHWFVVDPGFVKHYDLGSGRRMYRTGDLVRQNEDGMYSILGRKEDTQVKIRGQRVEFGEIEYWVAQSLPQVRQAAALLIHRDAGRQEGTLAVAVELDRFSICGTAQESSDGMLTPSKALQASFEQMRGKLMETLPRYMVPDMLIPMARFPLNNSGKLDRKGIKEAMANMSREEFESYRSTLQVKEQVSNGVAQELQRLWASVLGKREDAIGLDDNFFNLGADSMSAMQLVAAARSAGLKLTVALVFERPVLRDLCRSLEQTASPINGPIAKNGNRVIDAATRLAIRSVLPSHRVEAIFETTDFQDLAMSEHTVGNAGLVLYMTIAFDRKVDKAAVRTAYQHAVNTTEAARTTFVQHSGCTYQAVLDNFVGPFEVCETSGSLAVFCKSLTEDDQRKGLVMNEPPLKSWFVEGASSDTFILRLSHAQYDGLSLPMLLDELHGLNLVRKADMSPARQMSYYISALQSLDKNSAIQYWTGLLDRSSITVLPTRRNLGGQKMRGTAVVSVIPSPKQRRCGVTSATYVKAAWAIALSRMSGSTDVVFGHLISGRSVPLDDIEKVNGPCVNLIPIRVNTATTWETVLGQVQDQQVSSLPHEHLGFETIFKECTSWSLDPNQRPRFSTILQYQNLPDMCERGLMHGAEYQITYEATPANITDIWVSVEPKGDELHIFAGYFEEVIDSTVVQRLVDNLCQVLRSA
ncbi:NRPS protein [Elasticomyces elasticus]|nr:NRPS protein [Elasticomyces elasticus]